MENMSNWVNKVKNMLHYIQKITGNDTNYNTIFQAYANDLDQIQGKK